MKNVCRKMLAVLLALVVTLVPLFSVHAAESSACPMIDVHGFMAKDIYADPADPDSQKIWPPETDTILNAVKQSVPALTKLTAVLTITPFGRQSGAGTSASHISPVLKD